MNSDWAEGFLSCIQRMGEQHTNPVLLSLGGVQTVQPYQHYPGEAWYFGQGDWRVFYHSHPSPIMDSHEHGHFHFFTRPKGNEDWAHVVACSMDHYGQPINLFTTNRWVTDGVWFEAEQLSAQLYRLVTDKEDELPQSWFRNLLLLFQDEVQSLLEKRDSEVQRLCPNQYERCYIDRSIYYLSINDIQLEQKLQAALWRSA